MILSFKSTSPVIALELNLLFLVQLCVLVFITSRNHLGHMNSTEWTKISLHILYTEYVDLNWETDLSIVTDVSVQHVIDEISKLLKIQLKILLLRHLPSLVSFSWKCMNSILITSFLTPNVWDFFHNNNQYSNSLNTNWASCNSV